MGRGCPHRALRAALALAAVTGCATTTRPVGASIAAPTAATPDAGGPTATDASMAPDAPLRVAREPTPLEREVRAGLGVFLRVCGTCHEAMWRLPTGGHLPRIRWTEAAMRRQIREGSGRSSASAMPAIDAGRLPESEMPALFAYLRSIEAVVSPKGSASPSTTVNIASPRCAAATPSPGFQPVAAEPKKPMGT